VGARNANELERIAGRKCGNVLTRAILPKPTIAIRVFDMLSGPRESALLLNGGRSLGL